MQCPQCQFENPATQNFCGKCGSTLEKLCPQCKSANPSQYNFCGACGFAITHQVKPIKKETTFDEKLDKIQRYLPEGIVEKILAQRDKIEGERKQVTVLFCDMQGYSQLSERLGIEKTYEIMDQIYEILIHKVHDYGGTVNEMTGDGIMALFGAPIALEDAPQRAIRSAMAIHREMARFNQKKIEALRDSLALKMRAGVHTGPVVVGTLGNNLRVEFKAVGETVNLASRMEGLAEPGATYISEDTYKRVKGFFRVEALGTKPVKGKIEPIGVYRVIGSSSRRTRFDVSAEAGLTPFVGRDRELELLLDGFARSKNGKGQVFSIVSEAGLGKSRLLYEFRKAVSNENVTFLEGKCLSYSLGSAYHPVVDILKTNFNIQDDDGDLEIIDKVKRGLNVLSIDETNTLPFLLELLAVGGSGIDKSQLTPEAMKVGIIEGIRHIILKGSDVRPLILAFEDLHWSDNSSKDLIKDIVDYIPGASVLLILTYRPEFSLFWRGISFHSYLNLIRLSNRESLSLIKHLLGTDAVDDRFVQFILEKAEGVPFFIEEFIKSLKDLKIIEKGAENYHLAEEVGQMMIPSTIQDVLMARVDSLPVGAKEVIQTGSVIEREFSYEIISHLMNQSERDLVSHLSALKEAELIYERGIFPQTVYIFKHSLTRETVYSTLLQKRKAEIHREIGRAIEDIYTDKLDEFYEVIAHHAFLGEDWQRAYKFNREAGLKAHSLSAYEEEQKYLEKAIEALKNLSQTKDRVVQEIDLLFNMRAALFPLGRHEEWVENVKRAHKLSKEVGDDKRLASAYNFLSTDFWIRGHHKKAIDLCEEALRIAKKNNHFPVIITSSFHLGIPLLYTGAYRRQVEVHREVAQKLKGDAAFERHGLATLPSVLSRAYLAWGLAELGEFEEAEKWGIEGMAIAEKGNNLFSTTWIQACLGTVYMRHGKLDSAIKTLEPALNLCRSEDLWAAFPLVAASLGHAHSLLGNPDVAIPYLEEAVQPHKSNSSVIPAGYPQTALAEAYSLKGESNRAIQTIELALDMLQKKGEHGFRAWALYYMAKILSQGEVQNLQKATASYIKAAEQAEALGMKPLLAHCHNGLGQIYTQQGQITKARSELLTAIDLYREMDISLWMAQAETSLEAIK